MLYTVISGDIINSRKQLNYASAYDGIIRRLNNFNADFKDILIYPVTVFKGDEIQCVFEFKNTDSLCKIIRGLYYCFYPYRLRIGIGIGGAEINPLSDTGLNSSLAATGEAFFLAREAVETTKQKKQGNLQYRIYINCGKFTPQDKKLINLLLYYAGSIIQKWKKDTYEIISLLEKNLSHKEIARHIYAENGNKYSGSENNLRSNITYRIKYSDWYLLKHTEDSITGLIKQTVSSN